MSATASLPAGLTRNQSLVLGALFRTGTSLGAYAILDGLREEGLRSPLQVYRALAKLIERGLVHRIESLNAFVACAHPESHATQTIAFAICDNCGGVTEFSDDTLQQRLGAWCRGNDFEPTTTILEIHGHCGECRAG